MTTQLCRYSEPALLVLTSLTAGDRHGYAISDDIEALTGRRPGPGTLYGALSRLEAAGLVNKGAVELGFKSRVERGFELRSRRQAQGDEVAAQHNGLGGRVFQRQTAGGGAQVIQAAHGFGGHQRRTAKVVSLHHGDEFVELVNPAT